MAVSCGVRSRFTRTTRCARPVRANDIPDPHRAPMRSWPHQSEFGSSRPCPADPASRRAVRHFARPGPWPVPAWIGRHNIWCAHRRPAQIASPPLGGQRNFYPISGFLPLDRHDPPTGPHPRPSRPRPVHRLVDTVPQGKASSRGRLSRRTSRATGPPGGTRADDAAASSAVCRRRHGRTRTQRVAPPHRRARTMSHDGSTMDQRWKMAARIHHDGAKGRDPTPRPDRTAGRPDRESIRGNRCM